MILNRNNDVTLVQTKKSNMQEEIEANSKRHLYMYDQIVGTLGIKGGIAV
jgi:hypothetical protein